MGTKGSLARSEPAAVPASSARDQITPDSDGPSPVEELDGGGAPGDRSLVLPVQRIAQTSSAALVESQRPFAVNGHVKDVDGVPVAGATVCLAARLNRSKVFQAEVLTDSAGDFFIDAGAIGELAGLSPRQSLHLWIEAHSVDFSRASRFYKLEAKGESSSTMNMMVRPVRGKSVRGRLCNSDGDPIEEVEIHYRAPRIPKKIKAGLGGWFVVGDLPEVGELKLHAESPSSGLLNETFDLALLAPHADLGTLTCRASGVLAGTVVGLDGSGLEGERVLAAEHDAPPTRTREVTSGPGGHFRFQSLDPDAEYRMSTSKTSPSSILFRPSRADVVLEVPVYGCSLVLVDAEGQPLPSATCRVSPSRQPSPSGAESIFPKGLSTTRIGPGRFAVQSETRAALSVLARAAAGEVQWRKMVELQLGATGAEHVVVLEPERSVTLEVHWSTEDGLPLRNWTAVAEDLRPGRKHERVHFDSRDGQLSPGEYEIKFTPPEDGRSLATHHETLTVPDTPRFTIKLPDAIAGGQLEFQCKGDPSRTDYLAFVVPRGKRSIDQSLMTVMAELENVRIRATVLPPGPYDAIVILGGEGGEPPFKRIYEVTVEAGKIITVEFEE